ncbi:MAG: twitching motility protein PilT [Rhodospirillales bacterium 69-11]|nr:type II toxin-antitoxin system VapC family toxin [Rhodospirillales bacterium]MBN8907810.1 type II toxin-antitoxin system VapC family toxin [Rhodospirillales bacterium]MBN8925096.1 type II toxin-antitoxin system VapC family toxin [Rhodospirillales bacterium]OJW21069.1 MAG: twitching motility protein PilT [Rhodospirillales bacterium 69-11]
MVFVLDASIALCWAFADEEHPVAAAALDRIETSKAQVPGVWWFEVRNSLVVNERRGRLTETETASFLRNLAQLSIHINHDPAEASLLSLARQHRLTVYDAAYLELAQREGLMLATLDAALRQAASAVGVPLLGEAA